MALGDTYNNNEKKNYSPSVISDYRFSNIESEIDKTSLSFTFWNRLLKVSIAPKKDTEGDTVSFDYDNAGSVYLSHKKAYTFYKEIVKFIEEYKAGTLTNSNVGVNSGKEGLIYICDGKEFNGQGPCLVIRKINENGQCTSTFVYEFRRGVHSSVVNYVEKDSSFESNYHDLLELELVAELLLQYYQSMTMAIAYSIQEVGKYDTSRLNTKLKVIAEKLGVEFKSQNNNNNNRNVNNSYFSSTKTTSSQSNNQGGYSNGASVSYQSGSLDDLG